MLKNLKSIIILSYNKIFNVIETKLKNFSFVQTLKYNFILPLILNKLNLDTYASNNKILQLFVYIFTLCLILFFSFLNIIKDLYILYLINKYNDLKILEEKFIIFKKYPKCKFILN